MPGLPGNNQETKESLYIYRAVSRDVTRTNYDVAQKAAILQFGAHRKCMGQNRNFVKRER